MRTILGDLLKVEYLLYPPLNGAVTLATRAPVAPDQAVFLLESALSVNGLAMVRDARGSYHVGRADALKGGKSGQPALVPGGLNGLQRVGVGQRVGPGGRAAQGRHSGRHAQGPADVLQQHAHIGALAAVDI